MESNAARPLASVNRNRYRGVILVRNQALDVLDLAPESLRQGGAMTLFMIFRREARSTKAVYSWFWRSTWFLTRVIGC